MTSMAQGYQGHTVRGVAAAADVVPGDPVAQRRLGIGIAFPLRPRPGAHAPSGSAGMTWLSGPALVRQAIETILDTEPGERVRLPAFGSGLARYLMAPNTTSTRAAIARDVRDALTWWEPRIRVTDVRVTPGDEATAAESTLIWIDITYLVTSEGRSDNLVYPFYLS